MEPWSTIIVGVGGLAGIGGTLLAAGWQTDAGKRRIAAEGARARLADRRRVFMAAYSALNDGLLATSRAETSEDTSDAAALTPVRTRMLIAPRKQQRVASADVGRLARDGLNA